jgi:lipid-A-disaccharide synthase
MYGAQLMEAIRRRDPSCEFFGAGGPSMRAAGCETIVDAKDLSVVGISEIFSHLPKIYGLFRRLIHEADKRRPDLAIVVDSPAFNWRVARQMQKRSVPVVYYVCPQFWAWRQGRVRLLRKYVDKALVIFPFEEKFYREHGVDATFVGHPLALTTRPLINRAQYAEKHELDATKPWIILMPGSRIKEVQMNLPVILESAQKLGSKYEFLLPIAPTLERNFLQGLIGSHPVRIVPEALPALAQSRAGIIASGTATVEAAMMGTPFVMVYRVSPLTYFVGRSRVRVPYFAMVNLIARKQIVPELIQHDFTADKVVKGLNQIVGDGVVRDQMLAALADVKNRLRGVDQGQMRPQDRAADEILALSQRKLESVT